MLTITFTDPNFARTRLRDRYDLLLGVEATIILGVGDRTVFTEPDFPIVELRDALAQWLASNPKDDFEFESMESDEVGLVWFRQQPSGHWRAGSVLQDDLAPEELPLEDVTGECRRFIGSVDMWVRDHLNVDIEDVLGM